MPYRILLRRDLSQNWNYNDPVLMSGEPGYEMDTRKLKLGDGQTPWSQLPYYCGVTGATGPEGPTSLYSLPAPKVLIIAGGSNIVTLSTLDTQTTGYGNGTGPNFNLISHPEILPMNITQSQIDAGVWVEMVYSSKMRGKKSSSGNWVQSRGFKAFNSWVDGENTLTNDIISLNPGTTPVFNTRGGVSNQQNINRFNHYRVQSSNSKVNVSQYFYGLFTYFNVNYSWPNINETVQITAECLIPSFRFTKSSSQHSGRRYFYSNAYTPLYVKFRYIMWNPEANSGKGDFISGPLSETIKLSQPVQPFIGDFERSQINNRAIGDINPYYDNNKSLIKCSIQDNTP